MQNVFRISIAGLGTVGQSVIKLIEANAELIAKRAGIVFEIVGVNARDKNKPRDVNLNGYRWFDSPIDMVQQAESDVVVELIGGSSGIAYDVCEAALALRQNVVTANKAMIAINGKALFELAAKNNRFLLYEAAVAGGIPIIKGVKEGLSANRIDTVYGILNGTCNYILSTMEETGQDFADVLQEAQDKGYAEADPSFDIDGVDTAHKLAILSSLAFDSQIDFDSVYVEGIRHITAKDIAFASELGYTIRLLAIAESLPEGIRQRVHPCLVRNEFSLAKVTGARNAVVPVGNFVGSTVYEGWGAGGDPTASAVVADLIDIARQKLNTNHIEIASKSDVEHLSMDQHKSEYYVRLAVIDQPGVLADITSILRDNDISIESFLQHGREPEKSVPVVMKTHEVVEEKLQKALEQIEQIGSILEKPFMIRIENIKQQI